MAIIVILSAILGGFRIWGYKSLLFQGIAHIWVGGLFAWGIKPKRDWNVIALALALTMLEVFCALILKP
jgi:hypothetical protein